MLVPVERNQSFGNY